MVPGVIAPAAANFDSVAESLGAEKADRSARVQSNLTAAIDAYAEQHGVSKSVACDKVLMSPAVSEYVRLDKQLAAAERDVRELRKGDPNKWKDKFDGLVADYLDDHRGKSKSDAIMAVAATDKGKKCLANDKALRLGLPLDDDEDEDEVQKLGGRRMPTQRADEQSFPRAGGNVDPDTVTASDRKLLGMIADAQAKAVVLDIRRRTNCSISEAIASAQRLGIRLPKAVLDATADADFPGEHSGPLEKLQAKAEALREANPSLSKEQAFTKVYLDPNNRDLVRAEYQQRMGQ